MTDPQHVHTPSAPIHDDHVCNHVRCTECGVIGRLVDGEWQDIT